jgi:YD repeat-containing protein
MKTNPLFYITGFCIALLFFSCKKESEQKELRLLMINTTNYAGTTTTTTYHYNAANQLVEIKKNGLIERFLYYPDGKLQTYEYNATKYRKTTFHHNGDQVDSAVVFYYSQNNPASYTILYTYDAAGHISQQNFNTDLSHYDYTCDEKGRITAIQSPEQRSEWIWWDDAGNLVQHSWRGRNYEIGGWDSTGVRYTYDSGKNFLKAIPYPAEYNFIRSLDPSPNESASNCLENGHYSSDWPLYSGPISIQEYNDEKYPTKISIGETSWELIYEEYQPK